MLRLWRGELAEFCYRVTLDCGDGVAAWIEAGCEGVVLYGLATESSWSDDMILMLGPGAVAPRLAL